MDALGAREAAGVPGAAARGDRGEAAGGGGPGGCRLHDGRFGEYALFAGCAEGKVCRDLGEVCELTQSPRQETLRYHPIAFHIFREAGQDDVIPLAEPIRTETGEVISEIPVAKGQVIYADICAYNRSVPFTALCAIADIS